MGWSKEVFFIKKKVQRLKNHKYVTDMSKFFKDFQIRGISRISLETFKKQMLRSLWKKPREFWLPPS